MANINKLHELLKSAGLSSPIGRPITNYMDANFNGYFRAALSPEELSEVVRLACAIQQEEKHLIRNP